MPAIDKFAFCQSFVFLNRERLRFDARPYLSAVYASSARNLVVRASRQVEKSTFLVNTILFEACTNPGLQILFVCPRREQALVFSHQRLLPALEQSPLIRRTLLGTSRRKPQVTNLRFTNDAQVYVRAAFHSADAARGISAQLLLVDEFQDIAAGDLPVLQETLSHARGGRTILTGTPKSVDNHLEAVFNQSTANEWTVSCPQCGTDVIPDERCLGPLGVTCANCNVPIDFKLGRWARRNPDAAWGEGFWINHLMVPWLNYDEVLERRQTYDLPRFKNEALGLPTALGEHVVTREELEACCTDRAMANKRDEVAGAFRPNLVAGVDWGGGGTSRTVVAIGHMRDDYVFEVSCVRRFRAEEDPDQVLDSVAQLCKMFRVRSIAADGGGNGHVYNRLLFDRAERKLFIYAVLYSVTDVQPRQDGILWKWTVNRSATIGTLFSRVKRRQISFPRVQETAMFLEDFACEIAEYDDINRTIRYSHPETQQDDAMHATNYALLMGIRQFQSRKGRIA